MFNVLIDRGSIDMFFRLCPGFNSAEINLNFVIA